MVTDRSERGITRRRRLFQRSVTGRCFSHIVHPFTGERFRLGAHDPQRLADLKAELDDLVADVHYGRRSRAEACAIVELRFRRHGAPLAPDDFQARYRALRKMTVLFDAVAGDELGVDEAVGELELIFRGAVEGRQALMVRDLWASWRAQASAHAQRKGDTVWRRQLELDLGHLRAREVTAAVLARWQRWMQLEGYAPNSIRLAFELLRAAFALARREKKLHSIPWEPWRPARAVPVKRREAADSPAELEALLRAAYTRDAAAWAAGRFSDLGYRCTVLALCGLRKGEGAGLGWDRVDLVAGVVTIEFQALDSWRRLYPEKTRPDFAVKNAKRQPLRQQLHPAALRALRAQKEQLERVGWYRPDGPVFPTFNGEWRRNADCVKPEMMKELAREAGLPHPERWCVHSLRATFVTLELAATGDPRRVQARSGHASLEQLEKYVRAPRMLPASAIDVALPSLAPTPAADEDHGDAGDEEEPTP